MGFTNFPYGVTSFGVPVFGGLPMIRGTWYFVNPDTTADNSQNIYPGSSSNDGLDMQHPMESIDTAYTACVSGRGDGICLLGGGTSTAECSSYLTAGITWSKHGITTYGVCSGATYNLRARVTQKSGSTMYYIINVTGNNNAFYNTAFVNGSDLSDAQFCAVKLSGGASRNLFVNCDLKGTPATMSAYQCDLWMSNAHENMFSHCNLGNASKDRGNNAGAFIYFDGTAGNAQNVWEDCMGFAQISTGTAYGILKSGAITSLNGTNILRNCDFNAWQASASQVSQASAWLGTKPTTGNILVRDCSANGWDAWDSTGGNDHIVVVGATDGATHGVGALP